jgi:bacteriophage exclusion system BrxL-like protein
VRNYERLLTGGIWAQVEMRFAYDEEGKGKNPFWIDKLTPIQIAAFDLEEYQRQRAEFATDEWIDLAVRSMGYEPAEMTRRLKLLFLTRLIALCERNYNLVELAPRGTGKSYVVQEVSPYARPHDRSNDGRKPVRPHGWANEGAGPNLGRRRLRRGRRPGEDAEGSDHDDEDVLRIRAVPARGRRPRQAKRAWPC